jgi:sec-independent protein translocase protein TatB
MLPQFGFTEFLFIAIVALVVVGPKDLPMMMRKLGQFVGKARAMANEFRAAFDDIARQAELDELRQEIEDLKNNNAVKEATDEMRSFERDMNEKVMRETPGTEAGEAPKPVAETEPDGGEA